MHAALLVEFFHRFRHVASSELLHDFLQSWVFLSHDFIQAGYLNSRFLELLVRHACFDRLMLADVTHQQHTVVFRKAM